MRSQGYGRDSENVDDLPGRYHQKPTLPDGTYFFRRPPSGPNLAASLDLIPNH